MTTTIQHIRGDTFDRLLVMPAQFADGCWIGWTVSSQIRTSRGKLIADLDVSWAEPAETTRVLRLFKAETATWPIAQLEIDVQFVRDADGMTRSTKTLMVDVLRDVTQP